MGWSGSAKSAESSSAHRLAGALALLALAACARPARPLAEAVSPPSPPPDATCRHLDAAHSGLRVLVYRAGPLAHLGHNHVLVAGGLVGTWCDRRFALELPVAAFVVDPPAARAEEGPDFATVPDAADVEGTRRHLLGAGQLEGDAWPVIRVSGVLPAAQGAMRVAVQVEVRGVATTVEVPVTLAPGADGEWVASGGLELTQTSLGLVPYSVALGALRVRDELAIRFRLVAVQDGNPAAARPRNPINPGS